MINQCVFNAVTALCNKYSEPPIHGQEDIISCQGVDEVNVISATADLTYLSNALAIRRDKVYPQLSAHLTKIGQEGTKFIERKAFKIWLIDGMKELSEAFEAEQLFAEYQKEFADIVDPWQEIIQQFKN